MVKNKTLIGTLVMAILALVYMVTQVIDGRTKLKTLQGQYALQVEAVKHPAKTTANDKVTTTTTRAVNLTAKERAEISAKYNLEKGALEAVIRGLREQVKTTQDRTVTQVTPVIPVIPAPPAVPAWSAGILAIHDLGVTRPGILVQRDLGRHLVASAGLAQDHVQGALLYKFGK